jgi:hypothetical protein
MVSCNFEFGIDKTPNCILNFKPKQVATYVGATVLELLITKPSVLKRIK